MKRTLLFLLFCIALSSCESVPEGLGLENPGQYSRVYIAASYNGLRSEELQAPKNKEVSIWANYSGVVSLNADLDVEIGADLGKVDVYNQSQGTAFAPMEESCYTIKSHQVTIAAGATISSSPAVVEFHSEAFMDEGTYLLPLSITGLSDPSIALSEDLATLYIAVRCKAAAIEILSDGLTVFDVSQTENW